MDRCNLYSGGDYITSLSLCRVPHVGELISFEADIMVEFGPNSKVQGTARVAQVIFHVNENPGGSSCVPHLQVEIIG